VPLAGGQSLLPALKRRQRAAERLIDLGMLAELRGVERDSTGRLWIGAMTRHQELFRSSLVHEFFPALAEAASLIGDRQVRNRGTIGGNLCFADPRANLPPVLIAARASLRITSPGAEREVPVEALFRGTQQNTLAAGEIVSAVAVPCAAPLVSAYRELAPQRQGVPIVNVAAAILPDGGVGVAAGGLGATPLRLSAVEGALTGERRRGAALDAFDASTFSAMDDLHASSQYRVRAGRVLLARVLEALEIG
jgi:carbon-monoxide dehydrogenase medium subunit